MYHGTISQSIIVRPPTPKKSKKKPHEKNGKNAVKNVKSQKVTCGQKHHDAENENDGAMKMKSNISSSSGNASSSSFLAHFGHYHNSSSAAAAAASCSSTSSPNGENGKGRRRGTNGSEEQSNANSDNDLVLWSYLVDEEEEEEVWKHCGGEGDSLDEVNDASGGNGSRASLGKKKKEKKNKKKKIASNRKNESGKEQSHASVASLASNFTRQLLQRNEQNESSRSGKNRNARRSTRNGSHGRIASDSSGYETRRRSRVILERKQRAHPKRPNSTNPIQRVHLPLDSLREKDRSDDIDNDDKGNISKRQGTKRMTIHKSGRLSTIYLSTSPIVASEKEDDTKFYRLFALFPSEVLLEVLKYLEPEDLGRIATVNQEWKSLSEHGLLWKEICSRYYPEETEERLAQREQQQHDQHKVGSQRVLGEGTLSRNSTWSSMTFANNSNNSSSSSIDNSSNSEGPLRRRKTQLLKEKLKFIKSRNNSVTSSGSSRSIPPSRDLFFKNLFVELYTADLHLLKTGVWRNENWKPRKSPWSREDYQSMSLSGSTLASRTRNTATTPIKVVVIGDGAVGKTSLLCRYANGWFPTRDYLPTIFDNFTAHTIYNNENYNVSLWDTAGIEQYDRLRPLSYLGADIFLLCFDLVQPASLYNSVDRWITELNRHAPGVPIMLCGNKLDLRIDKKYIAAAMKKNSWMEPVRFDQAVEVAKKIGAVAYAESSALMGQGVDELFQDVMRYGISFFQFQEQLIQRRNSRSHRSARNCDVM